jgi:Xaa-Pro aminopeptidase
MESLHDRRLNRLREHMSRWNVDILVTGFGADFTYLTGMESPLYADSLKGFGDWATMAIFSFDRDPIMLLHPWHAFDISGWIEDVRVLADPEPDPNRAIANALAAFNPAGKTIALTKTVWSSTLLGLQAASPSSRFVPATNTMMDALRSIKDPEEIDLIARACEITDIAFDRTVQRMKPGMTERDVAIEVEYQLRLADGDGPSFDAGIISVGNGSDPKRHIFTRNLDLKLEPGMSVAFDFGVRVGGYCSDFGRSVFIGEPHPIAARAYSIITQGNPATMDVMRDGAISPAEIADFFRDFITTRDPALVQFYFYDGLGHCIGLEVHEEPWIKPAYPEPIRTNMVFTIEPKIWMPGVFYVRCEDTVVVSPDGARSLTHSTYDPIVVG